MIAVVVLVVVVVVIVVIVDDVVGIVEKMSYDQMSLQQPNGLFPIVFLVVCLSD